MAYDILDSDTNILINYDNLQVMPVASSSYLVRQVVLL